MTNHDSHQKLTSFAHLNVERLSGKSIGSIICYTDGSANWKNRFGGFGIFLVFGDEKFSYFKGFENTTISRQELLAVIFTLKNIKNKYLKVLIYSDSEYVVKGAEIWIDSWIEKSFINVANTDLWKEFLKERSKFPIGNVLLKHVRGHKGILGNEKADLLAKEGYNSINKIYDTGNLNDFIHLI